MRILAIDPGPGGSGWVELDMNRDGICVGLVGVDENSFVRGIIWRARSHVACEMIASYGMPVGADVFNTCVEIGRFEETTARGNACDFHRVFRRDVKLHLCGSPRAKDSNVRQALIDKFGGKEKAIGLKANPGPLYSVKSHAWAALAVGVTWLETRT